MPLTRQFQSDPGFDVSKDKDLPLLQSTKSEPLLRKAGHLLLDDIHTDSQSYSDLLLAAEMLESVIMEGTLVGATLRGRLSLLGRQVSKETRQMNARVLQLVYGTMKCMNSTLLKN